MEVKLKNEDKTLIMSDLKEGDIAVIITNIIHSEYVGKIIQIIDDDRAWAIGGKYGDSFGQISKNDLPVRKLVAGDLIEILD